MARKFITKNKSKFRVFKFLLFISLTIFSFFLTLDYLLKNKFQNVALNTENQIQILNFGLNKLDIKEFSIFNTETILKLALGYTLLEEEDKQMKDVLIIDKDENDLKPEIYIYNTHQTESYDSPLLEAYNISYTVETASYIMRDYLKDYGFKCFVETESMSDYLKNNNLLYKNSYEASRFYALNRLKEYPTIKFMIDVHRDSAKLDKTKTTIDGEDYAKVMFVVGLDHAGYEKNLNLAEELNSKLDPRLSRGISKKTGKNVNGIYNQDLHENAILLEIGGVDNSIEEVSNTLKVVSKIIFEHLNGE